MGGWQGNAALALPALLDVVGMRALAISRSALPLGSRPRATLTGTLAALGTGTALGARLRPLGRRGRDARRARLDYFRAAHDAHTAVRGKAARRSAPIGSPQSAQSS